MSFREQERAIELEVRRGLDVESPFNELQPYASTNGNPDNIQGVDQQLKPADGGITAWKVLFAAFMFEALLWGKLTHHYILNPSRSSFNLIFSRLSHLFRRLSRLLCKDS